MIRPTAKHSKEGWSFNEFWRRLNDTMRHAGHAPSDHEEAVVSYNVGETVEEAAARVGARYQEVRDGVRPPVSAFQDVGGEP